MNALPPLRLLPPTLQPWTPRNPDRAVAVLMSGGVDSSVTALRLVRDGWDAAGVTMRLPLAENCRHPRPCCGWEAATVCKTLGVPHYFLDAAEAFTAAVLQPFRNAYAKGWTPSPCVDCNSDLKFRAAE